jgi:hypothetical protein
MEVSPSPALRALYDSLLHTEPDRTPKKPRDAGGVRATTTPRGGLHCITRKLVVTAQRPEYSV